MVSTVSRPVVRVGSLPFEASVVAIATEDVKRVRVVGGSRTVVLDRTAPEEMCGERRVRLAIVGWAALRIVGRSCRKAIRSCAAHTGTG